MQFAGPYRNKKAISFVLYCTMSQHWKLLQLLLDVFTHIPNKTEQFFVVFYSFESYDIHSSGARPHDICVALETRKHSEKKTVG